MITTVISDVKYKLLWNRADAEKSINNELFNDSKQYNYNLWY